MTISNELNRRIIQHANKLTYNVSDVAPDTFETLKSNVVSILTVWSGASDKTIYGDAAVNHAFRAWHDSLHLKLNAPFTLEGEILVAKFQANALKNDALGAIIMAEVQGQAEYFAKHGTFPENQVEFIQSYLKAA
jgi:hypothetical protein